MIVCLLMTGLQDTNQRAKFENIKIKIVEAEV